MTARALRIEPSVMSGGPTVRRAVHKLLEELGLLTIFGNPGSTELPMFRDLPTSFRYILGLQEAIAVGMADGFAQASGRAALVNLHSSAGIGHGLGNLYTAYRNGTPLVVTAGQQARSILRRAVRDAAGDARGAVRRKRWRLTDVNCQRLTRASVTAE